MGVDTSWVKEGLESLQDVFDPKQCVTRLATSRWPKSESVCLRFVDAFGDTYFNQAQIPVLLEELLSEYTREVEPEVKAHLEKLVNLVEKAQGRAHTYIRFCGD
jgi:hypothetical protein